MNTQTQEALKMAIEALESHVPHYVKDRGCEALEACKEALAQPAQEPILPFQRWSKESEIINQEGFDRLNNTHPAPAWQGLSQEEQWNLINRSDIPADYDHEILAIARAIEQALKEKNT